VLQRTSVWRHVLHASYSYGIWAHRPAAGCRLVVAVVVVVPAAAAAAGASASCMGMGLLLLLLLFYFLGPRSSVVLGGDPPRHAPMAWLCPGPGRWRVSRPRELPAPLVWVRKKYLPLPPCTSTLRGSPAARAKPPPKPPSIWHMHVPGPANQALLTTLCLFEAPDKSLVHRNTNLRAC
jgi:hypothetical protein